MPTSAAGNRPEYLTESLKSEGETLLKALREVKNQIIGNKTKKLLYLNLGAVPKITAALAASAEFDRGGDHIALIVQSAAAIGSFACGVEEGVRAVLDAGAVPHLIKILSHFDDKVVDAGARSLRLIFQSKLAPKYDVLEEKNMKFLVSLLNSKNENVIELAASIISHSCERNAEQQALCDAGVLERLVGLFEGSSVQRDACLASIASILRNNYEVATKFACIDSGKALSSLIGLIHDRYPRTRLLACVCLIAIGDASSCYVQEFQIKTKMTLTLIELLDEPGKAGDDAPFALLNLIADKEELHKQAISVNVIEKLCHFLRNSPIHASRLQGILLVLAELCSKLEQCRNHLISLQVLDLIAVSLNHESDEVRIAACTCIKNISRSVKNLSAGIFSIETIVAPLVLLLNDTSTSIQVAALDAICNVAVGFTAQKTVFVQSGALKQLVQLSMSMDPTLRLKSVLALRNLTFLAGRVGEECILMELTVSTLASLITDSEHTIQEQALALLVNLIDGCSNSTLLVLLEDSMILVALAKQMQCASSPEVCIQGMLLLCNIAAGGDTQKETVMNCTVPPQSNGCIPSFMIKFMRSKHGFLRTVTVWCIVNLTCPDSASSSARIVRLRDAGVISQLKVMMNDSCLDCKFRVRMALEQCELLETGSS